MTRRKKKEEEEDDNKIQVTAVKPPSPSHKKEPDSEDKGSDPYP